MKDDMKDIASSTIEKIKEMADVKTIIGDPIVANNMTIIPVSTVTYGFGGGGSDFPSKSDARLFGGGGGAGITITPIAFLVISDEGVKMLHIDTSDNMPEKIVNALPNLVDKATEALSKVKKNKADSETKEEEITEN